MQIRPGWVLLLSIALAVTGLFMTHASDLSAQEAPDTAEVVDTSAWSWRLGTDPDTVKRPRSQLDSIIDMHRIWFETDGVDGDRAMLSGAFLEEAYLSRVDLRGANLTKVKLYRANLSGAWLGSANLTGARLIEATLTRVNLYGANLTGARLYRANLSGANLRDANLSSATLRFATIEKVWFEPDSLPVGSSLLTAKGFKTIQWRDSPEAIVKLREKFSELGLRQQEREVICALRRHDAGLLEYVFFDLTSEYGSNLPRI